MDIVSIVVTAAIVVFLVYGYKEYEEKKKEKERKRKRASRPKKPKTNHPTQPVEKEPIELEDDWKELQYSHWNPSAFHDTSVALIHGLDEPDLKWAKLNGRNLVLHGSLDHSRQVWRTMNDRSQTSGTITAEDVNGVIYELKVQGERVQHGPKWGQKRKTE